jgi:hypothetical protein
MINKNLLENFITDKEENEIKNTNIRFNIVTTFVLVFSMAFTYTSLFSKRKVWGGWH